MKKQRFLVVSLVWFFCVVHRVHGSQGLLIIDSVPIVNSVVTPSPSATTNVRLVTVYLPALSQTDPDFRFPVIYYLPGLGGDHTSFTIGNRNLMDDLLQEQQVTPMIIVHVDPSVVDGIDVDGKRRYQGTWYVNSSLNGNFEDFMVHDLIPYIDANYPTISDASYRAIIGQSMGGYGSMYHGISHSELYSAYGQASGTPFFLLINDTGQFAPEQSEPGKQMFTLNSLLIPEIPTSGENAGKITPDNGQFSFSVFSYAGAFSPNINNPPYFVDLPFEVDADNKPIFVSGNFIVADALTGEQSTINKSLKPRPEIIQKWTEKDPYFFVTDFVGTVKDQFIYMDGGDKELLNAAGARIFSDKLGSLGINHEYILYVGGHVTCLTSELCARHRTMFQLMSAKFAQAGRDPDEYAINLVGDSTITLQNNSSFLIVDDTLVRIITRPDLSVHDTEVIIGLEDNGALLVGNETIKGGMLECGNSFSKALLKQNPILETNAIKARIILNGPGALFLIGQRGVFGVAAGIDGKKAINMNLSSASTRTNVQEFDLVVQEGVFKASQIMSGLSPDSSLILIGDVAKTNLLFDITDGDVLGGANMASVIDSYRRHPVVLDKSGLNRAGGIRNNLNTSTDVKDYFLNQPIESTVVYLNTIDVGTLTSLQIKDDAINGQQNPYELIDQEDPQKVYEFLVIDDADDLESPLLTSKEASVSLVNGSIFLTYVDDEKIFRVPEFSIPIDEGQDIDLRAIAARNGSVLVNIDEIDGERFLTRIEEIISG